MLADQPAEMVLSCLQKICHDVLQVSVGGLPRFFPATALPQGARFAALSQWSRELFQVAKTADHPYQPGLLLEAWVHRAQLALQTAS